ncbi:uncharacterized protein LOC129584321 [Paramacrobiotus metropolitanus]|uniref:uncharacterized protein LOC129584321 n=1 Tax=Paramacrobiotus metropolitanus TaxID=2943436 RepID=UPI00244602B0|nr:uncharacterized protein LOC129584321 [Paramacrobiotus metropolitanus]
MRIVYFAAFVLVATGVCGDKKNSCSDLERQCMDAAMFYSNSSDYQTLTNAFQTGNVSFNVAAVANRTCRHNENVLRYCLWSAQACDQPLSQAGLEASLPVYEICDSPLLGSYVTSLITCNKKLGFLNLFTEIVVNVTNQMTGNDWSTVQNLMNYQCRLYQEMRILLDTHWRTIINVCGASDYNSLEAFYHDLNSAYKCINGISHYNTTTATNSTVGPTEQPWWQTTPSWWNYNTTYAPWWQTTQSWWSNYTTAIPWWQTTQSWWSNYTTAMPWWQTTQNWWQTNTTMQPPVVEIPSYLLTPFNVTCRRGNVNVSEPDLDLVDSLVMVFDGDNTLYCRLILNDLHSWILARSGKTREKRASDYEPVKVDCSRGNLTISSVDPGTSESTDLVFRTGGSKACITMYREFLTYIGGFYRSGRHAE